MDPAGKEVVTIDADDATTFRSWQLDGAAAEPEVFHLRGAGHDARLLGEQALWVVEMPLDQPWLRKPGRRKRQ